MSEVFALKRAFYLKGKVVVHFKHGVIQVLPFALATPLVPNRPEKYRRQFPKVETMSACVVWIENHASKNNSNRSPSPGLPGEPVHVAEVVLEAVVEFEVFLVVDKVVK